MNHYVLHRGQQVGPMEEAALRSQMVAGAFDADDLVWHEGMTDWKPLREVFPAFSAPRRPAVLPLSPRARSPLAPSYPTNPTALPANGPALPAARAASGLPGWVKVSIGAAVAMVLGVVLLVGILGYRIYRAQQMVINPIRERAKPYEVAPTPRPEVMPQASSEDAETLNNQGFSFYEANDYARARPLFVRAADLGSPKAEHNLGVMALYGQAVPKDPGQALTWFEKAAAKGYAPSQGQVGLCYSFYEGLPHDYAKAVGWFRKAAAQNDPQAVNNLAAMYEDGLGVPKDLQRAREGYEKSAALGYGRAKENLQRLASASATPEETPAPTRPAGSPFEGRWQGPWNDPSTGQRGTFTFTVAPNGSLDGQTRNDTGRASGPLRGTLEADGNLRANYSYTTGTVTGAYTAEGQLSRQGSRLTGKVSFFEGRNRIGGAALDLTGSPAGSPPAPTTSNNNPATAALASLTKRDKDAIKDALVKCVKSRDLERGMATLTGPLVSRENDFKLLADVKTSADGVSTTVFSIAIPARFKKGAGKEVFTLARSANGGWEVKDYGREMTPPGR